MSKTVFFVNDITNKETSMNEFMRHLMFNSSTTVFFIESFITELIENEPTQNLSNFSTEEEYRAYLEKDYGKIMWYLVKQAIDINISNYIVIYSTTMSEQIKNDLAVYAKLRKFKVFNGEYEFV